MQPVELAEHKSFAVLTFFLMLLVGAVSCVYQFGHSEIWLHDHVFQANKIYSFLEQGHYADILSALLFSNFVTINFWQALFSVYFLFTFGLPVERRLGPIRFICMVVLAGTIPWAVQFWDVVYNPTWPLYFEHEKLDTYFFGPSFILFTLASAYAIVTPYAKKRELYIMQSDKTRRPRSSTQTKTMSVAEHFGFSPELFVSGFVIYELVQRGLLIVPWRNLDTIGLYSVTSASLIGWLIGSFVLGGLRDSFKEHPLKHAALKRYYELLELDVGPETAIKGAARTVGLPDDQVSIWVHEAKGRLRAK